MAEKSKKTKRALVLSGGASFGAFQVGALEVARARGFTDWDLIAGVSVGALNGTMIALDQFDELVKIWQSISNRKVYTGTFSTWGLVWSALRGKPSVLGNAPLKKLIDRVLPDHVLSGCTRKLLIGVVSLHDGEYYSLALDDFRKNPEEFRRAILASTSIPLFWPPVEAVTDDNSTSYYELVDGGIRNVSPLGDVVDDNPDEIVIINCDPDRLNPGQKPYTSIPDIALRSSMGIMLNEIFRTDTHTLLRINDLVMQAKSDGHILVKYENTPNEKELKNYSTYVIQPECRDLMGDSLDFSPKRVRTRMKYGRDQARKVLP